jgi:hypothetical protein
MTRFSGAFLLVLFILSACNHADKIPDVSAVKADFTVERFDKDFFALDTTHLDEGLNQLQKKYPAFFPVFLRDILGIDNEMIQKGTADTAFRFFINTYRSLSDSSKLVFGDFSKQQADIKKVFQFVKYYFPDYALPSKIVTFIGPINANTDNSFGVTSDFRAFEMVGVGLHLHMGKDFSFYHTKEGQEMYPGYISRQFDPGYIDVNIAKNIVDDLFPEKPEDKPLVQQMVEKGRRLYLLGRFLPYTEEYKLISYSPQEYAMCQQNEKEIWDLFIQNNLLQLIDKNIVKNYITVGPKTQELTNNEGVSAPGNIGSFAGWQIVKKYMSKNPKTDLKQLMTMDPETIYTDSKYKP